MIARRLGWGGVAVAVVAFFIVLPPIAVRSPVPSLVLAAIAFGMGVASLRGGDERRPGWTAIVVAVLCGGLAVGATQADLGKLEVVASWGALTAATLRFATPLIFAGMALAAVHAVWSISMRADQIVSGTAINLIALGLTGYLYVNVYGAEGTPDDLPQVPELSLPTESLGFIGRAVANQNLLVWAGLVSVVVVWLVVFRSAFGLRLRSVGENPRAAETVGIGVYRLRYIAVIASGALAAAGGAFLSIGFVHSFSANMTAGRGFIALAAVIFGRWRPWGLLAATFLFGFSSALAQRLPEFSPQAATLFQALPYVLTLIAVAGLVGRSTPPAADGVPYQREG